MCVIAFTACSTDKTAEAENAETGVQKNAATDKEKRYDAEVDANMTNLRIIF